MHTYALLIKLFGICLLYTGWLDRSKGNLRDGSMLLAAGSITTAAGLGVLLFCVY